MGRILDTKTNLTQCGTEPTADNWEACANDLIGYVKGNVTMVMNHTAVGGYYACDDCCHMPVLNEYGDVEYRMEAAVKAIIREIDPWRLMFGSIACGETWYWTEEGAGLAMDVMMKEGCEYKHPLPSVSGFSSLHLRFSLRHTSFHTLLCCASAACVYAIHRRTISRLVKMSQMLVQLGMAFHTLPSTESFR